MGTWGLASSKWLLELHCQKRQKMPLCKIGALLKPHWTVIRRSQKYFTRVRKTAFSRIPNCLETFCIHRKNVFTTLFSTRLVVRFVAAVSNEQCMLILFVIVQG